MQSLKEALIKKHTSEISPHRYNGKSSLKPGYVIRYRNGNYAMYMDHDTTVKITTITSSINPGDMFIFWDKEKRPRLRFMRLDDYNDGLIKERTSSVSEEFDIMEIYPVKTHPMLMGQDQLLHLIEKVKPIIINK